MAQNIKICVFASTLPVIIPPGGGILVPGGNPLATVPAAGPHPQGCVGSAPPLLWQQHVDFDLVAKEVGGVASVAVS